METERMDQAALWNGTSGNAWIDLRGLLDTMLRPLETLLADGVAPGQRVLDVGCGTGGTTLALARRTGAATGVDISAPMIAVAQATAASEGNPARFLCADAQQHSFQPAEFDAIVSRFGVMFFADPMAAFANLRRAATPGGTLRFFAWRAAEDNPFMTAAERAVGHLLPQLPPRRSDEPGQFGFARAERVQAILADTGWRDIRIEPADVPCAFPLEGLSRYATMMGPVGRVLTQVAPAERDRLVAQVLDGFAPFVDGTTVRFTAACWDVRATA